MTPEPIGSPTPKPPEVVLPAEDASVLAALDTALAQANADERREAVATVVAEHPRFLDGWAALSELARDRVEAYAAARVGYHRGLDALRQNGWRGSGFVRWEHPENRGFLRCLAHLASCAEQIGETDEAERCSGFGRQLDPAWANVDLSR